MDHPNRALFERIADGIEAHVAEFPKRCCRVATELLYRHAGLQPVFGTFRFLTEGGWVSEKHWCSLDTAPQVYVDLTAAQFNSKSGLALPRVLVAPVAYEHFQQNRETLPPLDAYDRGIVQAVTAWLAKPTP